MVKWLRNTEFILKLCLLGFFLLLMSISQTYPKKSRLFPELLGGITVILIIASLILDILKSKRKERNEELQTPEAVLSDIVEKKMRMVKEAEEKSEDAGFELLEASERKKRLRQCVLIILISLGIGYLGGFLLTVPFYFITFGILHGARKQALKYIVIAFGTTVAAYLFFTTLMGIPLLRGALWRF